ncbi:hypothetical protein [Nocardia sp. CS682]|uniref:hypothetical protein n=1 Tax=Nocardia sp. CS682 TaxID=1047172 RepID=UPI00197D2246|nr:hypothetical protein [Nocardia sp. CS682]
MNFAELLPDPVSIAQGRFDWKWLADLAKTRFWRHWAATLMNTRQIAMLNRLLDGFQGKLTTREWSIITKSSQDSALRDINELVDPGLLQRSNSGGRSTSYELVRP